METSAALAVVVGANGGIGRALATVLADQGRYDRIIGVSRTRPADWPHNPLFDFVAADITDEEQVAAAAAMIRQQGSPDRIVVATGLLHGPGVSPEKTFRTLDPEALVALFRINAIAPALVAKHLLPLMPRDRLSVFAALSARVGSISDNRLGGWYGYRASKAALNMLIATLAVEHRRNRPLGVCVALHPGTVETPLSAPFRQGASTAAKRLTPEQSAGALVDVMDRLQPEDSGGFFAWDGQPIPW
ncbi:NAD(P)-dependent dehydrogenase (short-subunit alcohol dehydrogenase family) [Brevundimonas alba]|uniref:NAD(P)-dependent dehydrogenase (Short-subunit alcohol dehydrogenase family) n=1 Tax=Brevundimonas alba TaxID=74314 RepID=A0A7X5YHQ5_9CAUL|nr:SDR family NAD(P)-dependent oxidoreductase [Brevundimonas alba]NJC39899.1 NAD(P)-dependent dehydrogenase (short-subunit alcohol dehydrogenase family) [Brevundimonas alba]